MKTNTYARDDRAAAVEDINVNIMNDSQGNPVGFLGVAIGITRRKQAESEREKLQHQLLEAQKMEAVGQLAGGVAHDFNNILAAMLLHVELMRGEEGVSASLRAQLEEQQEFASRAANLTRQLLLFGRREIVQKAMLDLDSLLGNLLKMLRRLIGENISIEFKGSNLSSWVEADGGMIEQVVMNLVVNTRDAMPAGGRITLTTEHVKLGQPGPGDHPDAREGRFIRLTVADTGTGMDASTLAHIHEPNLTTKAPGKGAGLGLATVYGILQRHDGWIEVESAPGRGTTFRLHFPAARNASGSASPQCDNEPIASGKETIFLVEDDDAVRRAAQSILGRAGYRVITAEDGRKAMEIWTGRREKFDLLLTDMIMPEGLTGLELVKQLRKEDPDLKAILMSGYSLELPQQSVIEPEKVTFLAKPFLSSSLTRAVRKSLDGRMPKTRPQSRVRSPTPQCPGDFNKAAFARDTRRRGRGIRFLHRGGAGGAGR